MTFTESQCQTKKIMDRTIICTDRQTEWFLYTPLNVHGGIKTHLPLFLNVFFFVSMYALKIFLCHSRIYHLFGDVTIAGEGLQI